MAQIIGEDDLSENDQKTLAFGKAFETQFVAQRIDESRSIEESLDIAWEIMKLLPKTELDRLSVKMMDQYMTKE